MNERVQRLLEFDKIKLQLQELAGSEMGKALAEQVAPAKEPERIAHWQRETSEAAALLIQLGHVHMGPVHDIRAGLQLAAIGSYMMPGQLLQVADTLRTARTLKKTLSGSEGAEQKFPVLYGLSSGLTTLKELEETIERAIVSEDEISDNASPELRRIRRAIENAHASIRKKLDQLIHASENQKFLQDSLVTIRQDRFVVPVKAEHKSAIKGLVHDQSGSGATLYIEPIAVVELNNELRELKLQERDEIIRILTDLSVRVGAFASAIQTNLSLLAQIDFILAKGKLSVAMKGMAPELNRNGFIRIRNGRHPLLNPKSVVPTNLWLGQEFHSLLITGPNTGGKTVTLKTTGLLCLMFQTGLHVPADYGTTLPVFDDIFADIGDEQSIEQSLSTFSSHMKNIVGILDQVSPRSLVLLDELGAGTDPTEGAALAMAILTRLHEQGIRTLATTHYNELKQFALTRPGFENASVEFSVETLSPTYKLLIGVPGKSNAFEISAKLGLKEDIIEHARLFVNRDSIQFEDVLTQIEESRRAAEADRDEALRLRLEADRIKKRLDERSEKLSDQKDRILNEARDEARKVLKTAREESEAIIRDLRQHASQLDREGNRKIEEARSKLRTINGTLQEKLQEVEAITPDEVLTDLKLGELVKVVTLNQTGTVLSLPDPAGEVQVQLGIMKMKVPLNQLKRVREEKETKKKYAGAATAGPRLEAAGFEVDVRGKDLEEAWLAVDKFIDDAYLSKLEKVHIIHGKGTGVLRKGLQDYMKRHPHVKSMRDGGYYEGGNGVTVVELK